MAIDHFTDGGFQREVCDWFRANGVDPSLLPVQPKASITDGNLTFRQRVRGEQGGILMDMNEAGMPILRTVTVPLQVPPPERIAEWLDPGCPTCGR